MFASMASCAVASATWPHWTHFKVRPRFIRRASCETPLHIAPSVASAVVMPRAGLTADPPGDGREIPLPAPTAQKRRQRAIRGSVFGDALDGLATRRLELVG